MELLGYQIMASPVPGLPGFPIPAPLDIEVKFLEWRLDRTTLSGDNIVLDWRARPPLVSDISFGKFLHISVRTCS